MFTGKRLGESLNLRSPSAGPRPSARPKTLRLMEVTGGVVGNMTLAPSMVILACMIFFFQSGGTGIKHPGASSWVSIGLDLGAQNLLIVFQRRFANCRCRTDRD